MSRGLAFHWTGVSIPGMLPTPSPEGPIVIYWSILEQKRPAPVLKGKQFYDLVFTPELHHLLIPKSHFCYIPLPFLFCFRMSLQVFPEELSLDKP